jgi:hypothetical protein
MYYTKNKADDSYTADDEVASQIWVRDLIAGELGRPLPAAATHADLIALTDMRLNDWIYVWDDTYDPGTGDIHVGETWAYAYDGSGWVELVRINEVQIQDDDTTLTIDPVSGKRKVKEGGIGSVQLAAGAAADNIIGNRTLEDQAASSTLVAVTAKDLTAWLQGFRNNIKYFLDNPTTVDGIEPDANNNVQTRYEFDTTDDYLDARDSLPVNALVVIKDQFKDITAGYLQAMDTTNVRKDFFSQPYPAGVPENTVDTRVSWTADADGFLVVRAHVKAIGILSGDNIYADFLIDGNVTHIDGGVVHATSSIQFFSIGPLPVAKGQLIHFDGRTDSTNPGAEVQFNGVVSSFFFPPLFKSVPQARTVVEPGSDYSLDEQPVLINDNGTIRQKQWLDGSPVYKKLFYKEDASFTTGAQYVLPHGIPNLKLLLDYRTVIPTPAIARNNFEDVLSGSNVTPISWGINFSNLYITSQVTQTISFILEIEYVKTA